MSRRIRHSPVLLIGAYALLALLTPARAEDALRPTTAPVIPLNVSPPAPEVSPGAAAQQPQTPPANAGTSAEPGSAIEALQRLYEAETAPAAPPGEQQGTLLLPARRTFFWLCILCALIILLGYALRRYSGKTPLLAGQRLGTVLGKMYLDPKTSIHYVKTGGRVLLVGVTSRQVALLAEFEAEAFEQACETLSAAGDSPNASPATSFLSELQAHQEQLTTPDDDLVMLRGDIQRLQQSLQEKMREHR